MYLTRNEILHLIHRHNFGWGVSTQRLQNKALFYSMVTFGSLLFILWFFYQASGTHSIIIEVITVLGFSIEFYASFILWKARYSRQDINDEIIEHIQGEVRGWISVRDILKQGSEIYIAIQPSVGELRAFRVPKQYIKIASQQGTFVDIGYSDENGRVVSVESIQ